MTEHIEAAGHVPPRLQKLNNLTLTPRRVELRRLAAASRSVIEHLVSTAATVEEIARAADELEEVAALLRSLPAGATYDGYAEVANAGVEFMEHHLAALESVAQAIASGETVDPEAYAFFDHSPFIGLANPLSPPVIFKFDRERITGSVTFGSAYEGPPGCVHGGYVAATFDELLGAAQSLSGTQGMTARLVVNYRSPTPLHTELRLEARMARREGRKLFCEGWLWAGELLCAEAEGLFLSMDAERFQALLASRRHQAERSTGPDAAV